MKDRGSVVRSKVNMFKLNKMGMIRRRRDRTTITMKRESRGRGMF